MQDFSKERTPGISRLPTSPTDGDLTPPDVKRGGVAAVTGRIGVPESSIRPVQ